MKPRQPSVNWVVTTENHKHLGSSERAMTPCPSCGSCMKRVGKKPWDGCFERTLTLNSNAENLLETVILVMSQWLYEVDKTGWSSAG